MTERVRGPFADDEQFQDFKRSRERRPPPVRVEKEVQDGRIFGREVPVGGQAAALGVTAGAATGAAAGAMVGGPIGAAFGAAVGAAVGAVALHDQATKEPVSEATPASAQPGTVASLEEPPWLTIAHKEIGQKEVAGSGSNPRIEEYFTWTSLGEKPDDVSWCGAFVSFCLGQAGLVKQGEGSARAASWLDWGETLTKPRPGCVVVLEPQAAGASGHVGFWVKEESGKIHLLAGNQSNRVNMTPYPATELQPNGYRWPTSG